MVFWSGGYYFRASPFRPPYKYPSFFQWIVVHMSWNFQEMHFGAFDGAFLLYTRIINPISFWSNFFFKWSEIFSSDSLGYLTREYDFFFDLVNFEKKNSWLNFFFQKLTLRNFRLTLRNVIDVHKSRNSICYNFVKNMFWTWNF